MRPVSVLWGVLFTLACAPHATQAASRLRFANECKLASRPTLSVTAGQTALGEVVFGETGWFDYATDGTTSLCFKDAATIGDKCVTAPLATGTEFHVVILCDDNAIGTTAPRTREYLFARDARGDSGLGANGQFFFINLARNEETTGLFDGPAVDVIETSTQARSRMLSNINYATAGQLNLNFGNPPPATLSFSALKAGTTDNVGSGVAGVGAGGISYAMLTGSESSGISVKTEYKESTSSSTTPTATPSSDGGDGGDDSKDGGGGASNGNGTASGGGVSADTIQMAGYAGAGLVVIVGIITWWFVRGRYWFYTTEHKRCCYHEHAICNGCCGFHPYDKRKPPFPFGGGEGRKHEAVYVAPCFPHNPCAICRGGLPEENDVKRHPCGFGCGCDCAWLGFTVKWPAFCLQRLCEDELEGERAQELKEKVKKGTKGLLSKFGFGKKKGAGDAASESGAGSEPKQQV